jgi:hypothetical protein
LNTPTLAWYFLFSQLMSFATLQKTPSHNSCVNPCIHAEFFGTLEVSKKH